MDRSICTKDVKGVVNAEGANITQHIYHAQNDFKKESQNLTSLPPINTNFIGREADLKSIEDNLKSDNVVCVVNGIGGVGKSELSYKYLHKHKDEYQKIAFIEMTQESGTIEEVFRIKFQDALHLTREDNFDTIMRRLQAFEPKNLLVLDNLLNDDDFKKIKPLNVNFDILITTRAKLESNNIINLETLNDTDAKKLFLSIYDTSEDIQKVLNYLDNHPLFINLTAYSLKEEYIKLDELIANINNGKVTDIDSKDEKTFKQHLNDTFDKQFKDETNEELKQLLQTLSLFPATEISFEMLRQMLKDKKLKVKLQKLVNRGWLSKKDDSYKLHQIIKTFMIEEHPLEYLDITYILENIGTFIDPTDSSLIANHYNDYNPIIDSLLYLFEKQQDEAIAMILDSNTYLYYSLGEYQNALDMQEKSCNIREKLYGDKSELTAKNYNLLGAIYKEKAIYDQALPLYKKAIKINENILGENHPDTASNYSNLAVIYQNMGKYNDALPLIQKALQISKNILGENHPFTATSYNNLAEVYIGKGKYDKALYLYKKALKIWKTILGEKHPNIATIYNNLAEVYREKGEYDKALILYQKALEINEEVSGKNHPDTAKSYNNLALLYNSKGEYDKALPFFEKSIQINEEVLGENHPFTATNYNNLALLYKSQGKYPKALLLFKKSLMVREYILGKNHPDTATSYDNLAGLYHSMEEYNKALPLSEKTLEIREYILDKNHPDIARSYNNLASLYKNMGKYHEALPLFQKALQISEDILGVNHPDTATSYNNLGILYKDMKLCTKAKEFLEKCIKVVEGLEFSALSLLALQRELKDTNDNIKKQQKAKFKDKGRYCKEE